ncbi:MAG TPA: ATP phosphoribosyltransferase, partial [Firmicutes bacterium]|nr:ATP phosphoribosyltransferase [Bacillota bacterium]
MTGLLLALPTGRLLSDTLDRLAAAGVDVSAVRADNRRLLVPPEEDNPGFLLVKPADVPVYVEAGCADAGIVGKDVLLETQKNVCELLDLAYGFWRLVVAIPAENRSRWPADMPLSLRIATKYP